MNDAGYTATESLAALAILGLALGGLASGIHVVSRAQSATSNVLTSAVSERAAADELTRLMRGRGPFRSDHAGGFAGASDAFSFPCGARRCGARVAGDALVVAGPDGMERVVRRLGPAPLAFAYVGGQGTVADWPPPPPPPPAQQWQVLQSVLLSSAESGRSIGAIRVWVEQAADCEFDPVIQDCRPGGA